jgi:hypothetical protein
VTHDALVLLDRLERAETSLLVWGVTDGVLTQRDLDEVAIELMEGDRTAGRALVAELVQSQLLLRTRIEGDEVFRTRMAETVRLAATLRQLFESNAESNKWRAAPRLATTGSPCDPVDTPTETSRSIMLSRASTAASWRLLLSKPRSECSSPRPTGAHQLTRRFRQTPSGASLMSFTVLGPPGL